jgi:hypothetical protein
MPSHEERHMGNKVHDLLVSYARTLVPMAVIFVAGLISKALGVESDNAAIQALVDALQGSTALLVSMVYYAVIRALEMKYPWIGILLGYRLAPIYKL